MQLDYSKMSLEQRIAEDKKLFLEKLVASNNNVGRAAKSANIGRATIYRWIKEDEHFKAAVQYIREDLIDNVEEELYAIAMDDRISHMKVKAIEIFLNRNKPAKEMTDEITTEVECKLG
jgi:hypothetical protein